MLINSKRQFCYRICHIKNLPHILDAGLCTKNHPNAHPEFISIGNPEIIDTRATTKVRLPRFGHVGDYIPFYFTPRSIMLYNIVTGYYAPLVPKVMREEILVIRCLIEDLSQTGRFFFTDGQANDAYTNHYNDLKYLNEIDWAIIQNSNFNKDGDLDRPRRYQAEFLVHHHVPLEAIQSLHVYNNNAMAYVKSELDKLGIINLQVHKTPDYFFN